MNTYTVGDVAPRFQVDENTVRRWADEFTDYLSTHANPGKGKTRLFNDEDLQVLALVSAMKSQHATFDDIHASLKNGIRGEVPDPPHEVMPSDNTSRYELQIRKLEAALQEKNVETTELYLQVARLETEIKMLREQKDNRELLIEIGRLQAKLETVQSEHKD